MTDTIRDRGAKQLIIIGSPRYSYDLSWIDVEENQEKNVAYVVHIYPSHTNWRGVQSSKIDNILILVTEWGFCDNDVNIKQNNLKGNVENFSEPFTRYMEDNEIGWVVVGMMMTGNRLCLRMGQKS